MSPILFQWFCVEKPAGEDFDNNEIGERAEGEVGEDPRIRESPLRISLKRLQKEVDREGHE